jgi:DNA-binding transcriptional ArsR family regulator
MGVREAQRTLKLSSPSTALYHLEKLRRLGLVEKNSYGQYTVVEEIKVGTLRQFVRFGKLILPRYLFYAAFFWTALISYLAESWILGFGPDTTAVVLTACAVTATTYEAVRTWRERLF